MKPLPVSPALARFVPALLALLALSACRTTKPDPDAIDASAQRDPAEIVIVPPEGIEIAQLVERAGFHRMQPYEIYNPEAEPLHMVVYEHRYVELDGKAPAELLVSMINQEELDMVREQQLDELPDYTGLVHHVFSFAERAEGELLVTIPDEIYTPWLNATARIEARDLDRDGRQELLILDDNAYVMPLRLYTFDKQGRFQDMIWGEPQAQSFVPLDYDGDKRVEIIAIPTSYMMRNAPDYLRDEYTTAPFVLAPDGKGMWREGKLTRPTKEWLPLMMRELTARPEPLSPTLLFNVRTWMTLEGVTLPAEVHAALRERYAAEGDATRRAKLMAAMPWGDAAALREQCAPVFDGGISSQPLLYAACLLALSEFTDEATRAVLLERTPALLMAQESDGIEELYRVYELPGGDRLVASLSACFQRADDPAFARLVIEQLFMGLTEENSGQRRSDLYMVLSWNDEIPWYEQSLEQNLVFNELLNALSEALEEGEGRRVELIGEPLTTLVFSNINWLLYQQDQYEAGEQRAEPMSEEERERLEKMKRYAESVRAIALERFPAEKLEKLTTHPDPLVRRFVAQLLPTLDRERFARVFPDWLVNERDEMTRNAILSQLYVIDELIKQSVPSSFWLAQIRQAAQATTPDYYTLNVSMGFFVNRASPEQIAALWDELTSSEHKVQLVWSLSGQPAEALGTAPWASLRERWLAEIKGSQLDSALRYALFSTLGRAKDAGVVTAMIDATRRETDPYTLQSLFWTLASLEDERVIDLFVEKKDVLSQQPYAYLSILSSLFKVAPARVEALVLDFTRELPKDAPLDSSTFWSLGSLISAADTPPRELLDWLKGGLQIELGRDEGPSCMRMSQELTLLFLAGEKGWESQLEKIEAHPSCADRSRRHVARLMMLSNAVDMYLQEKGEREQLRTFIRQHHDFPQRAVRVIVSRFDLTLEEMAKQREKEANKPPAEGGSPGGAPGGAP